MGQLFCTKRGPDSCPALFEVSAYSALVSGFASALASGAAAGAAAGAAGALLCAALFPQYLRFLGIGFACYLPCALVFSLIMVCSLLEKPITEAMK